MKNIIIYLGILGLILIANPCIGQISEKITYPADQAELNIDQLDNIENLNIHEEPDLLRISGQSDTMSVNTTSPLTSGSITIKKVRLDPEELKIKLPSVIYEYPDGMLEIDYESLVSILFIAYAKDKETIKLLKEEVKELKDKVDKIKEK